MSVTVGGRDGATVGLFGEVVAGATHRDAGQLADSLAGHGPYQIRIFGDPVLKSKAADVTDIDGKLVAPGRRDVRR